MEMGSSHLNRLKCIYLDDLLVAIHECHENFQLIKKNLYSIERQLKLRCHPPKQDKLLRTERGLILESAYHLQEAMKEVLSAVEEHFNAESITAEHKRSSGRPWTVTEDLMRLPGSSGMKLIHQLAEKVAEERIELAKIAKGFSLSAEMEMFRSSNNVDLPSPDTFDALVEAEQQELVRSFLRTKVHEKKADSAATELRQLRKEYMDLLSRTAIDNGVEEDRLRDLRDDWNHGLDMRLEHVALEAEARSLETLRSQLQAELQEVAKAQEMATASLSSVDSYREEVARNQAAIRDLSQRNSLSREQLSVTREELEKLAEQCSVQLQQLSTAFSEPKTLPTLQEYSPIATQSSSMAGEEVISRVARQVVSENETKLLGRKDFEMMLRVMKDRAGDMGSLKKKDSSRGSLTAEKMRPILQDARRAKEVAEATGESMRKLRKEKEEIPKIVQ